MSEKVNERLNALPPGFSPELRPLFEAIVDDLTALRTSITGVTAQLDLDATVTDTDYAANNDPAALTTLKS